MLPDRICDVLLSGVESVDLATEEAHEVQTSLARHHAVHLGMVVDADISDQLEYAIECETHLPPDMGLDIQKLVDIEKVREYYPNLVENPERYLQDLGIIRSQLRKVSHINFCIRRQTARKL